jgi:phage terminase large subunit GpA-like protein
MNNGRNIYIKACLDAIELDTITTVDEWADKNRTLDSVSTRESGNYRTSRTPYLKEIMQSLSVTETTVNDVVVMKATQIGLSEVANNFIGYIMDCVPGPILYMLPTVELAERHSKTRITPMINNTPSILAKVTTAKSRKSGNTITTKNFTGGALFMAGSNSGASFRNVSIRYLILDDIDGFSPDIGGEGSPISLAERRTDTYSSKKKILKISTPTQKGGSLIEKEFQKSDQRFYHVPCPFCGTLQILIFSTDGQEHGLHYTEQNGNVTDTWYTCKNCQEKIHEHHKTEMLEAGQWIPSQPNRKKRGYHISGLLSPLGFVSWSQIAQEYHDAKKDSMTMMVWVNTRLGEPYESAGEQPEWVNLYSRKEPYQQMKPPNGVRFITGGVDVQENRIAVLLRGWGVNEESWLIFHAEIYGEWEDQLDDLLSFNFTNEHGVSIPILGVAIDSGYKTQQVYSYCRSRNNAVFAVKGERARNKPIIGKPSPQDLNWRGKHIPKGVHLWPVGTDTAKSTIYGRLKNNTKPGPYCYHWHTDTSEEYFLQLTSEKIETRIKDGFPYFEWIKTRDRNEALDIEVYAYAAAVKAGLLWIKSINKEQNVNYAPKKPKLTITSSFMER